MANIAFSSTSGVLNGENNAAFAIAKSPGVGYGVAAVTGTIAAALAANSSVFAMRLSPATTKKAYIQRVRVDFSTIVAFTTPVTAGRRLAIFRGAGAAASGGTAVACANAQKASTYADCQFTSANGGDMRIASTGLLTVTGITYETDPFKLLMLTHVGAAGAFVERVWEFHENESEPLTLQPGQVMAIRNPVAMDAAGTWQLGVQVEWYERD